MRVQPVTVCQYIGTSRPTCWNRINVSAGKECPASTHCCCCFQTGSPAKQYVVRRRLGGLTLSTVVTAVIHNSNPSFYSTMVGNNQRNSQILSLHKLLSAYSRQEEKYLPTLLCKPIPHNFGYFAEDAIDYIQYCWLLPILFAFPWREYCNLGQY